jgi:uncharacterized protein (DUF1778 family)
VSTRERQLNTRLSDTERKAVEAAAKKAGLGVSEWLRSVALAATETCPTCGSKPKAPRGQ